MGLKLRIVRGSNPNERMKSIDGLIDNLDRKLQAKTPDDKLKQEIVAVKQTLAALMDFLGLAIEPGPKKVIKQVRITNAFSSDNS